ADYPGGGGRPVPVFRRPHQPHLGQRRHEPEFAVGGGELPPAALGEAVSGRRIVMNEMMRNCMEWMVSLGWVGLLLLAVLVAAVVGVVVVWVRQIRHGHRQR